MTQFSIEAICERVAGRLEGAAGLRIDGVEQIDQAGRGDLTFIGSAAYGARWAASRAAAALVQETVELEPGAGRAFVRVANADLALATVLEMFAPPPVMPPPGVHPSAVVDAGAELGDGVAIGPLCCVGPETRLGAGTVLHANVSVLTGSTVGAACTLWPGVVIRERCVLGDGCELHPNVSIGADGFGYRPSADGRSIVKIPQIGTVRIGRDVEIGAGTCVDRGKFSATSIGDGTKIDNLCQIAHNCVVGRCVLMAALVAVGGSVTIGDGVMIGGGAVIKDHVTIGPAAQLGGHASLMHDVPAGGRWTGTPAQDAAATFREYAAIRKLPELIRELEGLRRAARATS